MTAVPFDYSNLSDRPSGRLIRTFSLLSSGVREVQRQVHPYAIRWQAANREALLTAGPLWVAIGDSMTQGIGASAFDQGWVGQLASRGTPGLPGRVVNLSVSGARVQDVLDRQLPALESLGIEPDLVTVLIGSNDLVSRRHRSALEQGFEQMLSALPIGSVVATLPNPTKVATRVNSSIESAVDAGTVVPAELRGPQMTSWRGKLARDHFHPNDRGYAGIAQVFAQAISARR